MERIEPPPPQTFVKPQRPIWLYVGASCSVLLLAVIALGFFAYKAYSSAQAESTAEAKEMLAEIGADWEPDVI